MSHSIHKRVDDIDQQLQRTMEVQKSMLYCRRAIRDQLTHLMELAGTERVPPLVTTGVEEAMKALESEDDKDGRSSSASLYAPTELPVPSPRSRSRSPRGWAIERYTEKNGWIFMKSGVKHHGLEQTLRVAQEWYEDAPCNNWTRTMSNWQMLRTK